MAAVLFLVGILVSAAGVFAIGFGITIHDVDLRTALTIAGTSSLVGGLILIGLGAAVRELRRLARLLERASRPMRPAEETARAALGRVPFPPKPVPAVRRGREPRLDVPPVPASEQPRSPASVTTRGEPPVVDDRVPLSPAALPRTAVPRSPVEERGLESKFQSMRATEPSAAREQSPDHGEAGEQTPQILFESVWPSSDSTSRIESLPQMEPRPEEVQQASESARAEYREDISVEPKPVSILKSGVIDGMAYTLYTDGSIEAQLPQGVMRFASIEELRLHLEKHG